MPVGSPNGASMTDVGISVVPAIMLTLDLLLLSPPWTIKFQGALTLSTFLAFAYCKSFYRSACPP